MCFDRQISAHGFFFIMLLWGASVCQAAWTWPTYEAEVGTLPQEQNWTFYDANEPTAPVVSESVLHQGPTSGIGIQNWYDRSHLYCFDDPDTFYLYFELKVIQSDYEETADNRWRTGYGVWVYDNTGRYIYIGIASDGVRMTRSPDASAVESTAFFSFNTTDDFHLYVLHFYDGKARLSIDGYGYVATSLPWGSPGQGDSNIVGFGDASPYASSETELRYFGYYVANSYGLLAPGWVTDMDDLAVFGGHWLQTGCTCPDFCGQADFNQDGVVDIIDLSVLWDWWLQDRPS